MVVEPVGKVGRPKKGVENKNNTLTRGSTNKEYRIAKLKRDFGEDAVNEAAKTHKTASALERYFGVGKPEPLLKLNSPKSEEKGN